MAVQRLENLGAIERFNAMIDGKPKQAFRSLWNSAKNADAKNADANSADAQNAEPTLQNMQFSSAQNADNNININKPKKNNSISPIVEQLYKLYPTVCPSTGRRIKKGERCVKLLKEVLLKHTAEEITKLIKSYVEVCQNGTWMMNFDRFLRDLPDFSTDNEPGTLFPQSSPEPQPEPQKVVTYKDLCLRYPRKQNEPTEEYRKRIEDFANNIWRANGYEVIR